MTFRTGGKDTKPDRLKGNVVANIVQTVCSTGILLLLYRYINETLGIGALGVWSVVVATASVSQAASFGLGEAVTRFVAMDRERGGTANAALVVDTAFVTVTVVASVVIPSLYFILAKLLPFIFAGADLEAAKQLLPIAVFSLLITVISSIALGALEGCQRMGVRAALLLLSQVLLLVLAESIVPKAGIMGLAWAQVGQSLFLLLFSRFAISRSMPFLAYIPNRWSWHTLREMFSYGANVQLSTIVMLLFLPVAKAMMASFGGAAAAGYFEIANQFVLKVRSVLVAANRAIVPVIAECATDNISRLTDFYRKNLRIAIFFAMSSLIVLVLFSPLVSWLAIGSYNTVIIMDIFAVSVGWCLNLLGVPSYFFNCGTGRVGVNTIEHVLVGTVSFVLALALGPAMGTFGVLVAYVVALAVGACWQFVTFRRLYRLPRMAVPYSENRWLFTLLITVLAWVAIAIPQNLLAHPLVAVVTMVGGSGLVAFAGWKHQLTRSVVGSLGYKWRL